MLSLNLKIALRNLWKNKGYAFISISGLAVALAIFILAMLYANYQNSYDKWNDGYENVFRVNYTAGDENVALSPGNMATYSKEKIAAVMASTRVQQYWSGDLLVKTPDKSLYINNVLLVDSNFFKVFQYQPYYGDVKNALQTPQDIVLSKAYSETLFGEGVNPVGKTVTLGKESVGMVTAVIDEARYPSHFKFNLLKRFKVSVSQDFGSNNYYTYIKLAPNVPIAEVSKTFNKARLEVLQTEKNKLSAEDQVGFDDFIAGVNLYLQPVKDIHLNKTSIEYEFENNGIGTYIRIMVIIAFLVLIIAAVNFTNLSVTMTARRAKETSVRKVLGAQKVQIGIQFILDTTFQCLLALVLSAVLVELFLPAFNNVIGSSIVLERLSDYRQIGLQVLVALGILILVVGLYPAFLISNIAPAKVLKGNFSSSNKGAMVRNTLIVVQFAIAVLFISGIWIINSQLNFLQDKDLGYKQKQVLAINIMEDYSDEHFRKIKNTLSNIDGVNFISRVDNIPGEDMGGNSYGANGKNYPASFLAVDVDYFDAMGMKMIEGRGYNAANPSDTLKSVVLTQSAAKKFELNNPVGKTIKYRGQDATVIGLVKDFNQFSPEKDYQPIVFQYAKGNAMRYVLINLDPVKSSAAVAKIEQEWTKLEANYPIKYTFLDKAFEKLLSNQSKLRKLIGLLSGVTIGLALMGLFAIAAFNTQRRNKEINIRKVLGATLFDVLKLLNSGFALLVSIANILAIPVAYFILNKWLSEFAFRIEMPVLPFVFSALITLVLTIIVVSLQSLKAANANPVDALKYE